MKIGSIEITSPVRLAPMADITNAPFRLVARECGSSLLTSEEIDAHALCLNAKQTLERACFLPQERPIALQLLGHNPLILAEAAKRLQDKGADIIDLNMGCPVPKIISKGQGAALMREPLKAAAIFRAMRKALRVPFTIKIRGGWNEENINAVEIARLAEAEGIDAITVHPRTRSQRFTGQAPWQIIKEVAQAVKIPVTGNGDVRSHADALRMMRETAVQSVMIGRGALGQPWVFDPKFDQLDFNQQNEYKLKVIKRHRELILAFMPERAAFFQLKKHLVWYLGGFLGAGAIRHQIFLSKDADAAWKIFLENNISRDISPIY